MKYPPIDSAFYVENRKRFCAKLEKNSLAIFQSNDEMPRNGDQNFLFRQQSDILYMTGIDQEETILILYPDCPREEYKEVLLLKRTNEKIAQWEGHKVTEEEGQKLSGIKKIMWTDDLPSILHMLMVYADHVYLDLNENDRLIPHVDDRNQRFVNQLVHQYPLHHYHRAAKIMMHLRQIKQQTEIEMINVAIKHTANAFQRVLKFVKPGVKEYEIEAEVTHEFVRNGCKGHAYEPIIASGKNACVLHYIENSAVCKDGDLLLLDFGADYANYAADLTRTIPVNGKFSARQKKIYNAVLRVHNAAKKLLKPGTIPHEINEKIVGEMMQEELLNLHLLKKSEVKKQDPDKPAYKKYFMHGTSHHLGLDVHDFGSRFEPMKPGMIFTCEPGIYVPEENIGIRIENDVLITKNGNVDLMSMIPLEADEIETAMKQ